MTSQQRFYTIADTADVLATSPAQVYALLRRGQLRGFKLGGRGQWRVGRDDTATWVADNPWSGNGNGNGDTDGGGGPDNPQPGDEPAEGEPGDA